MIAFSELMAIDSGHHKWNLSLYDTGRYMRLDAAAQRALNVMKQRTDANDTFSLYGLMNKGRTPMAKRLLKVRSLICSMLFLPSPGSSELPSWALLLGAWSCTNASVDCKDESKLTAAALPSKTLGLPWE